jgi:preprotein translocase subunit SecG
MVFISVILLVIFVISALLLIVIVMMQDDQGEGLGGIFGGSSNTAFGSRSGNILTRTTSILGAIFMLTSFGFAWINHTPESGDVIRAARQEAGIEQEDWWNQQANDADSVENGSSSE